MFDNLKVTMKFQDEVPHWCVSPLTIKMFFFVLSEISLKSLFFMLEAYLLSSDGKE